MSIFNEFPYTNFHELNLDWILKKIRELAEDWSKMQTKFSDLETYVQTWFNENAPAEIASVLNQMAADGTLTKIFNEIVEVWALGFYAASGETEQSDPDQTGDLYLIKTNEKNILIDTGWAKGAAALEQFFSDRNVTKLDYLIITHYHADHAGGMSNIKDILDLSGCVAYLPPTVDPNVAPSIAVTNEALVIGYLQGAGATISPNYNDVQISPNITLKFYNTDHSSYYASNNFQYNNCCICPMFDYLGFKVFFAADIDYEAQEYLATVLPSVDIASIAHHGYNEFYSRAYFNAIQPQYMICSDGRGQVSKPGGAYENFTDFVNMISTEAWYAENRGINIYDTAHAENYILHFAFALNGAVFYTDPLPPNRITYHYNSWSEIFGRRLIANDTRTMTIYNILDAMNDNSTVEGFIDPSYGWCPRNVTGHCYMRINKQSNGYITGSYSGTRAIVEVINRSVTSNVESQIYNFYKPSGGSWTMGMRGNSMGSFARFDLTVTQGASVTPTVFKYAQGNDISQNGIVINKGLYLVIMTVTGTSITCDCKVGSTTICGVRGDSSTQKTMIRLAALDVGDQITFVNNSTTNPATVNCTILTVSYQDWDDYDPNDPDVGMYAMTRNKVFPTSL